MRLINVHTLEMSEFLLEDAPAYVTLSHRWSKDETNYEDFINKRDREKSGYKKIEQLCCFVRSQSHVGYTRLDKLGLRGLPDWIWIDTACIDKRSSAELSESINSMWNIYKECAYCLVYLEDVQKAWSWAQFRDSEWFTRGWTLQELLAPSMLVFCTDHWTPIATKPGSPHILTNLQLATGIDRESLELTSKAKVQCVAKKLSWASKRRTTRKEDRAYSLLGLLDVNMPLLYGEGETRAFLRLQEELIRRSDDESIFAWIDPNAKESFSGILASRLDYFMHAGNVGLTHLHEYGYRVRPPYAATNKGLHFSGGGVEILVETPGLAGEVVSAMGHLPFSEPGAIFVFALNYYTAETDYHFATSIVESLPYRFPTGLMALFYGGRGRWYRWLLDFIPERGRTHVIAHNLRDLWQQGREKQATLLVELTGNVFQLD